MPKLPRGALEALRDRLRGSPLFQSLPQVKQFDTWHGSPYTFMPEEYNPLGAFRNDKIGSGEGAQAFSHGHYTSGSKGLATEYRDTLARRYRTDGSASGERQTKKELSTLIPDMAYAPPLRFNPVNSHSSSDIGSWLQNPYAGEMQERMMANPTWVSKYVSIPRDSADPVLYDALRQLQDSKDPRAWLSDTVLDVARDRVNSRREMGTAGKMRAALPRLPEDVYKAVATDLQLPGDPKEVTSKLWNNSLLNEGARGSDSFRLSEYAALKKIWNSLLNSERGGGSGYWLQTYGTPNRLRPSTVGALTEVFGLRPDYLDYPREYKYNNDIRILGRNGMLEYAKQLSDPARLAELRAHFGVGDVGPLQKSLYRVRQDVSPDSLWFLDSPLIGQNDDFIKRFLAAGKALDSEFGTVPALGSTGHDTYNRLRYERHVPNKQITDKLLEAQIPGAMFLRGGHRDFDKVLTKEFDPYNFNFVTYDPALTTIVERFRQGGQVSA